jgi:cell division protease FtsH
MEVRSIVDSCYKTAKQILEDNLDKLHKMAEALMEFETLAPDQIDDIMAGAKPRAPTVKPEPKRRDDAEPDPIGGPAEET